MMQRLTPKWRLPVSTAWLLVVVASTFAVEIRVMAQARLIRSGEIKTDDKKAETKPAAPKQTVLDRHKATMRTFGIEPTDDAVRDYLNSYQPNADTVAETQKWVKALKSSSYTIREEASKKLVLMPVIEVEYLQQLMNDDDLEVAYRAKEIFAAREKQVKRLQLAVFGYLIEKRPSRFAPIIFSMRTQLTDPSVVRMAYRAIEVIAEDSDMAVLEKLAGEYESNEDLAVTCLRAILRLDKDRATQWVLDIQAKLKPNRFKLFCAGLLAQNKNKECLDFYVDLLGSTDMRCRSQAFGALRSMIDQKFEYSISAEEAKRNESIRQWRDYVAKNKDSIDIEYRRRNAKLGRLLVASYSSGKIDCYDEAGKLKWSANGPNPFTCQGLANGHVVVMFYSVGKLVEYDENGKVFKEFENMPKSASGLQRLENGHTILSAGQGGNKIVEIDDKGKEVWSVVVPGTPTSSRLQENGLFLTALFAQSKLVEIDRKGKIVNEIPLKGKPYTAHRLDNDNILVAFASGGVAEYTQEGEELWRAKTESNTYWADVLNDGTVVVADKTGILKFTREGKFISRDDKYKSYTYISAY